MLTVKHILRAARMEVAFGHGTYFGYRLFGTPESVAAYERQRQEITEDNKKRPIYELVLDEDV